MARRLAALSRTLASGSKFATADAMLRAWSWMHPTDVPPVLRSETSLAYRRHGVVQLEPHGSGAAPVARISGDLVGFHGRLPPAVRRAAAVAPDSSPPARDAFDALESDLVQVDMLASRRSRPHLEVERWLSRRGGAVPKESPETGSGSIREPFLVELLAAAEIPPEAFTSMPREQLAGLSGWLRQGNSAALEQAASETLRVPVRIDSDATTRHELRLRVGPLSWPEYRRLLPPQRHISLRRLLEIGRWFAGPAREIAVLLVLRADEVPSPRLARRDGASLRWGCWPRRPGSMLEADVEVLVPNRICRKILQERAVAHATGKDICGGRGDAPHGGRR